MRRKRDAHLFEVIDEDSKTFLRTHAAAVCTETNYEIG